MWYLEVFDKKTELLAQEWRLVGIDESALRQLVRLDDGYEGPFAPYDYDLKSPEAVLGLVPYIEGPFEIDELYDYQVGYSAEPGEEGVLVNGLHPPPRALPEVFKGFVRARAKDPLPEADAGQGEEP